jgi:hypothetical protein
MYYATYARNGVGMSQQRPQRLRAVSPRVPAIKPEAAPSRPNAVPIAFRDARRFPWTRFDVEPAFTGCTCKACGLAFVATGPDPIWSMRIRVILHLRAVHGWRPIVPDA